VDDSGVFAFASVGIGRWKAERFRSGAYRETKEVAERQSRLPTESGRICAFHQSGRAGAERSETSRSEVSAGRSRNGASVGPAGLPDSSWDPCCSVNLPLRAAFADDLPYSIWSGDFARLNSRRSAPCWKLSSTAFAPVGTPGSRLGRLVSTNPYLRLANGWQVEWTRANTSRVSVGLMAATLAGAGASVGMLATEAERFRSGEDRDGGSNGAPEPSSQRKRSRLSNVIRL